MENNKPITEDKLITEAIKYFFYGAASALLVIAIVWLFWHWAQPVEYCNRDFCVRLLEVE